MALFFSGLKPASRRSASPTGRRRKSVPAARSITRRARRLACEPLEDRMLLSAGGLDEIPPTVVGTTPSLTGHTLGEGTTSLSITFSESVLGGSTEANYQIQGLGADGLLGTADDVIIPLTVSCTGTTATLEFAALPESFYRLTVRDTITDFAGNKLDGHAAGTAGGDWTTDFVVRLFYAPATYSSGGSHPRSVAIGDLNGDGRADLAVANCDSNDVGVLLGQSDGTFSAPATYSSGGSNPFSVAIGDLNGDGLPDLAVANYDSNNVGVLLGQPDGTFAAAATYSSGGSNPCSVAIGDLNGDGLPDLAVANFGSDNVGVLFGQSDGTLAGATYSSGGSSPFSVAIGDLNGDGLPDLAVANFYSDDVAVLLGQPDGTLAAVATYRSGGSNPCSVAIGDLNGDGRADLAVANPYSNDVGVLLGQSDGTLAAATYSPGGNWPRWVAIGDLNGDGLSDLAVANYDSDNVGVLLGQPDGTLAAAATYGSGRSNPFSVAIGDLNGDGHADLAVSNCYGDNVGVLCSAAGNSLANVPFDRPPVVEADAGWTITEGGSFSGSGWFTDPVAAAWIATADYGDGSGLQALALNADKTFALDHVYADHGTYTVTLTVTDDYGGVGSDTLAVTSSGANSGTEEWVRQFGGSRPGSAMAEAIDAEGDVYVAGTVSGYVAESYADVTPDQVNQVNSGNGGSFLRKYDASGEVQWTRQFAGGGGLLGIFVYASDVYVAEPGWVCKYDASGNELWARQFELPLPLSGSSFARATGLFVDASGVYVTGYTNGTLPGQSSAGGCDAFVSKYDLGGVEEWTRQFGSESDDYAFGISADASGVYVVGETCGTLPGQSSAGSYDAFVRKYDTSGNELWTRQFGTSSYEWATGICVDGSAVYVTGPTRGAFPGQSNAGQFSVFVRKYDASGTEQWTRQLCASSYGWVRGVCLDGSGVYVTGCSYGTFPGQSSAGGIDSGVTGVPLCGDVARGLVL